MADKAMIVLLRGLNGAVEVSLSHGQIGSTEFPVDLTQKIVESSVIGLPGDDLLKQFPGWKELPLPHTHLG